MACKVASVASPPWSTFSLNGRAGSLLSASAFQTAVGLMRTVLLYLLTDQNEAQELDNAATTGEERLMQSDAKQRHVRCCLYQGLGE